MIAPDDVPGWLMEEATVRFGGDHGARRREGFGPIHRD